MRFTLLKKPRTVTDKTTGVQEMIFTYDGGEYRLGKHVESQNNDKVSRLTNWRKLLTPGRDVEILEYQGIPVVARLRLQPDDELLWDSEPLLPLPEYIPFWLALHRDRIKPPKAKPEPPSEQPSLLEEE